MDPLNHASSYRILCPLERYEKQKHHEKRITVDGEIHQMINIPYYILNAEDEKPNHHHSLRLRNRADSTYNDLFCWACHVDSHIMDSPYYFCSDCEHGFHKDCVESLSVIHSTDHPKHPLQLLRRFIGTFGRQCCSCRENVDDLYYYCNICDFPIHIACAKNPTPYTLDNRKRHEHTLYYFPRKSALVCDVCGLKDFYSYLYVCLLCDFIVHKRCVYLPYVIKTSRHIHRLAFTPTLPYKEWIDCGVCYTKIDENYGEYSCIKGCVYAVHSRCAMRSDVCDGRELEGEPEETYECSKMFEEEGDGIIRHQSHKHHQLKLERNFHDANKQCQACMLLFYVDGNVYRCMQCDFILHESCAYLTSLKLSMLHVHPLVLDFSYIRFNCWRCGRYSCGFTYTCRRSGRGCSLVLDTRCASIEEPFEYHSHPHPLFITSDEDTQKKCSICQSRSSQPLNCIKCDFTLCFHCATLPLKARYEHHDHLLTFSYQGDPHDDKFYGCCEICEEDINPKTGLYACMECGVTLHIECLLGKDPYLKPTTSHSYFGGKYVCPNTSSTRPICKTCKRHCPYKIKIESSTTRAIFCSMYCEYYGIP